MGMLITRIIDTISFPGEGKYMLYSNFDGTQAV